MTDCERGEIENGMLTESLNTQSHLQKIEREHSTCEFRLTLLGQTRSEETANIHLYSQDQNSNSPSSYFLKFSAENLAVHKEI